jgi:hypothetical protein
MESKRRRRYAARLRRFSVFSKDKKVHFQVNRRQPELKGVKELASQVKLKKATSQSPTDAARPTPSRRTA